MQGSDLAVRRHERYVCDVPALVTVAPASAEAVRLSRFAVSIEGRVPARITDFSGGGLSLSSPVFFPSTSLVALSMEMPGQPGRRIDLTIRVQRVAMSDRKPSYYVGGAFENPTPDTQALIASVLTAFKTTGAPLIAEKPRA